MGAVYARAYVTIIAANGWDANHGLRGIRNVTEPRHLSRYTKNNFYESLQPYSSIWYSRGWTFQEMIFARRKIMLHYQVAVWECQCATWHEATKTDSIPSISNGADYEFNGTDYLSTTIGHEFRMNRWVWRSTFELWPDVRQYIEMVHEYTNRELTFPTDGLRAIAGLITVWNRSFHGGFICGLPQMFFDDALLWQQYSGLQRRISKRCDGDQNVLPSWSWAGWQGRIEISRWASQWDYLSLNFHQGALVWKLTSTVKWFHGDTSGNWQPVEMSSHRYRACVTDESVPLPSGWTRKPAAAVVIRDGESATQNEDDELAKHAHFVHERFPGVDFGYPVPLPKKDQEKTSQTLSQFLFGRTRRGYFKGSDEDDPISLINNDGKWAGMIVPHDKAFTDVEQTLLDGFELVSISAGTAMSKTSLSVVEAYFACRGDTRNEYFYEFYNVLWIEWEKGVAYRKGLGRVRKEFWERQATEWIDLTLG